MKFLKRKILSEIQKWLDKREILILLGPRQVWKTTILKYLFENIKWQKYWFDLDIFSDCEKFMSFDNIVDWLKLNWVDFKKRIYLFVDEFQYCRWVEIVFKNLYDRFENIKILASGSSSLNIKNLIQESLAGRKKIFYIYPLDFEEFVSWKLFLEENIKEFDVKIFDEIKWDLKVVANKFLKWLYQYMIFGGYPKVVLEIQFAPQYLENIFDLYLKKDILDLLNIRNLYNFKKLIQSLAINNWSVVNYSELSKIAEIDIWTVKNYIEILQETFLIRKIVPFFTNKNKEISKSPKIYFVDNGVRNYFIKNFTTDIDLRQDKWVLFEAVVMQELLKNWIWEIKYRRTKTKVEVDFVIDKLFEIIWIEVKFKEKISKTDFKGLLKLKSNYSHIFAKWILVGRYGCDSFVEWIECLDFFRFIYNIPLISNG